MASIVNEAIEGGKKIFNQLHSNKAVNEFSKSIGGTVGDFLLGSKQSSKIVSRVEDIAGDAVDGAGFVMKGTGSRTVNEVMKTHASGFRGVAQDIKQGDVGIKDILKNAYTDGNGGLNYTAIAGSYVTASAAGRVLSGGGLTKDKNGNTNIISVPFV